MAQPNRLKTSMSPYLLQHAENPVDWFPWGDEAFGQAKKQDKPIFLSIGYSSCHWCHVMAHECFEDQEVAALMNDAFVSIKVDREELPHIDHVYMHICQLMTGSGGWPLTIVMTPDKEPFFAATYLPKHARHGLKGLMELIPLISQAWNTNRGELAGIARRVSDAVKDSQAGKEWHASRPSPVSFAKGDSLDGGEAVLDAGLIHGAFNALSKVFQPDTGGFHPAPKFPSAHHLMFLLRYFSMTGNVSALAMVEKTLDAMRQGGIYDHLGHGFHRYATDSQWRIPHFEKMLYDQALLALTYTEAFQVTSKRLYRLTASGILDYVLREMRSANSLFFSAQDADVEGEEGGPYLWTVSELQSLLGSEDYRLFSDIFAVEAGGNFPHGPVQAGNILFMREGFEDTARRMGISPEALDEIMERLSRILLEARSKRVPPLKDDKSLTDWNGLMIAALARAGAVFNEPQYTDAACAAADFILESMKDGSGRLLHVSRAGKTQHRALLDDYSFLIWGLIEIYQATFRTPYLDQALSLMNECCELFLDQKSGAFYLTPKDMDVVIVRPKELMDNALPSGNSVAFANLVRLSRLTGDPGLEEKAQGITRAASPLLAAIPSAASFLMTGILLTLTPPREVVIAGDLDAEDAKALLLVCRSLFLPDAVIAHTPGTDGDNVPGIAWGKGLVHGKAAAYICQGRTCLPPVTTPEALQEVLSRHP